MKQFSKMRSESISFFFNQNNSYRIYIHQKYRNRMTMLLNVLVEQVQLAKDDVHTCIMQYI